MEKPKLILLVLCIFFICLTGFGAGFTIGIEAGYFLPGDEDFSDIYGSAPVFGLNAGYCVSENLQLIVGGNLYNKSGATTITSETTEMNIFTFRFGGYYLFKMESITPKLGAGIAYASVDEETPFGGFSDSKIGWFLAAGLDIPFGKILICGVEVQYSDVSIEGDFGDQSVGGLSVLAIVRIEI
jgi:opacity protein-like surface antigen